MVTEQLDHAIRQLLCACFPGDAAVFARSRAWHDSAPAYSVVALDGERLVGHIGMVEREVLAGTVPARIVGVQNFCVATSHRGTSLSQSLMMSALAEATLRRIPFGLLFCIPEIERIYVRFGWRCRRESVAMRDEFGRSTPIPDKNICMGIELTEQPFPPGPIDLCGRDW